MNDFEPENTVRPRRSVLCVPAINERALQKLPDLDCDAVIFDLEDSVAVDAKAQGRDALERFFDKTPLRERETIIRINPFNSPYGAADLQTVLRCAPDAVLLPKVDQPSDIHEVSDFLAERDGAEYIRIWAMIETPRGVLNAAAISEAAHTPDSRLSAFVVGLNDLRKETGVPNLAGRTYLVPWLMQIVLAAKAYGLDVIDSVSNDFRDVDNYASECEQGRAMGFDGKMLIHPAQIAAANQHFAPSLEDLEEARSIVAAFAAPEAAGLNIINANGRMIERLHVAGAEKLLRMAQVIAARKAEKP